MAKLKQDLIERREVEIRRQLLMAGVKNLKEFGYKSVTAENITTDYIFGKFFVSMLEETGDDTRLPLFVRDVAKAMIGEVNASIVVPEKDATDAD